MPIILPVDESSRVAEVRRAVAAIALNEGLGDSLAGNAAVIATEAATNLLNHARKGEVCISALSERGFPGVEILALDQGPGIQDISRCMSDGHSSGATSGTGLGAIRRLSTEFDIYSQPGKGTVVLSQIHLPQDRDSGSAPRSILRVGAVAKPIAGEQVSGDAWAMSECGAGVHFVMADGLGHGILAAEASAEALTAFRRKQETAPVAILQNIHRALRGTRGAAVAAAYLDFDAGVARFAGIGNIAAVLAGPGRNHHMVSHNGTAGHETFRFQEFVYPLDGHALFIMHSDGLTTSWNLDPYPGLRAHHPAIIAGVLYRDASRNRDDVCVVVAQIRAKT
ncbi:MAG TPA: ATP-binding SpoIIE family protein phosphatase [Bryobacteraceae bacterium]|nr:ATP-binding SpoIIE family protein phosphatase [Bryobacteraceae bacterium]